MQSPTIRIRESALFGGLPATDVNLILSKGFLREAPRGTFLFRQGEPAKELFLLESGRVRLHEVAKDSRELLVRFVVPGEVFGDKAALPSSQYGGTAVCEEAVRAVVWPSEVILRLLEEIPRLCANLFAIMMTYLHYSRERYRLLATSSAESRIRWALRDMARRFGQSEGTAKVITSRSIQSDIAELAMTTIYTVSRVLRLFEQRGLLNRTRGRIVLLPSFR